MDFRCSWIHEPGLLKQQFIAGVFHK